MTDLKRKTLRLRVELKWKPAKRDSVAAGTPFGNGRGINLWVEYGERTTVNERFARRGL
jgi:hypothetical protein